LIYRVFGCFSVFVIKTEGVFGCFSVARFKKKTFL
jgi:hypothetical protein